MIETQISTLSIFNEGETHGLGSMRNVREALGFPLKSLRETFKEYYAETKDALKVFTKTLIA